jgi:hypothetical protein
MKVLSNLVNLILLAGVIAGILALSGGRDSWSPRDYIAPEGTCIVPPQGDPLYDAWYANNVNNPNCTAFLNQARAGLIDSQANQIRAETTTGLFGVYSMLAVLVLVVILLGAASLKGGGNG